MTTSDPNCYVVLGIPADATLAQIRTAFREAAKTAHPDRGGDAKQFRVLQDAYDTLRDPTRRRAHDDRHQIRIRPVSASGGANDAGWAGASGDFTGDVSFPGWLNDVVEAPWRPSDAPDDVTAPSGPLPRADVVWWWPRRTAHRPAAAGALVVMASSESLVACEAVDGHEAWEAQLGAKVASPPVVVGSSVLVGTDDGVVHSLELGTGVTRWARAVGDTAVHEIVPLGPSNDRAAVVAAGARLAAVELGSGGLRWSVRTSGAVRGVAVAGDGVVCTTAASTIESFALRKGRNRWRRRAAPVVDVPPVAAGVGVWIALTSGRVACVDPTNGSAIADATVGQAIGGLVATGSDLLVAAAGSPRLVSLRSDGTERWAAPLPLVTAEPAVLDEHAVLAGPDTLLRTYELATGAPLVSAELPFEAVGPPVPLGDRLVIVDTSGNVWTVRQPT